MAPGWKVAAGPREDSSSLAHGQLAAARTLLLGGRPPPSACSFAMSILISSVNFHASGPASSASMCCRPRLRGRRSARKQENILILNILPSNIRREDETTTIHRVYRRRKYLCHIRIENKLVCRVTKSQAAILNKTIDSSIVYKSLLLEMGFYSSSVSIK